MKFAFAAATAALLLAACGGSEAPATDTPAMGETAAPATPAASMSAMGPAPGRWQNTVTSGGQTAPPSEWCYEQPMSLENIIKLQQQVGIVCSEQTFSPDGKSGHSVCMMDTMKVTSDIKVTGDYATAYTMEVSSSFDPALPGLPNPSVTTITAQRMGDCTADTPRLNLPE
jgi:hypothetical protein